MARAAAVETLRRWRREPVAFVRECLRAEPDAWQADVLAAFPSHPRLAMKACKGPGKTAVLAWLCWNFLVTRPSPKIAATSITGDNLADGLWSEMALWMAKSQLLQDAFVWRKTRIESRAEPEHWWMSARSWAHRADPTAQANTLAGLHADYLLFVLDEAGGIPDAVMAAAEAGLANARDGGGKEAHIVIAGNPTHLEGPLYRASTSERHLWHVTEISGDPDDPKRSPRVSAEWAKEQIQKYGRSNPWVVVNVFGQFPPSSLNALLGPDEVRAAMQRSPKVREYEWAPRVLGVDVARHGDDRSVIFPRQGIAAFPPIVMRQVDGVQGAGACAAKWRDWEADACFIDNSGGFGASWLDQLRHIGHSPVGVQFAGAAADQRYANKRAEMWFQLAQWVKEGGALPDEPEIVGELTAATYTFVGDRLLLEDKDQIKAKIHRSPDLADALALTFAAPVYKASERELQRRRPEQKRRDPFARFRG